MKCLFLVLRYVRHFSGNTTSDYQSQISGSKIVWFGNADGDCKIYLYDGSGTRQLLNNITDVFLIWHNGFFVPGCNNRNAGTGESRILTFGDAIMLSRRHAAGAEHARNVEILQEDLGLPLAGRRRSGRDSLRRFCGGL